MDFDVFVQMVKKQQAYSDKWDHIFPSVPERHRERFLNAVTRGISMPKAYDLVLITAGLADVDFYFRLEEIRP